MNRNGAPGPDGVSPTVLKSRYQTGPEMLMLFIKGEDQTLLLEEVEILKNLQQEVVYVLLICCGESSVGNEASEPV